MCDGQSFLSAGSDFLAGVSEGIDARSRADFEQAQLDVMSIAASAQMSREESAMRRSYGEQVSRNMAAMAVSGLDPKSFEAVMKGNREDMNRNIATLAGNLRRKKADIALRKSMADLRGEIEASAALWGGISSGAHTLQDAEDTYQKTNTGESRWEFFSESVKKRNTFFQKEG